MSTEGYWTDADDPEDDYWDPDKPGGVPEGVPGGTGPGGDGGPAGSGSGTAGPGGGTAGSGCAPCWSCNEEMAGNLLRCPSCGQTRTHLVLTCAAPELVLTVGAGAPLNVGRDPGWATLTAQPLRALTRISRRHVTVLIDPDGTGWAEEYADGTVNGTHVGDTRLRPGVRTILRDGDRLRLGREIVSFRVRLYGPDPTGGANASRAAGEGYGPAATA